MIICQGDTCDGTTDALKDARLTNFLLELIACGIRQIKLLCLDNCKGVCGRIEPSSFVNSSPHWSYSDALRELLARYLTFQCIPRNEFLKDSSSVLREISETKIPTPELPIIFGTIRHHAPEEESVGLNRSSQIYDLLIPSIEPKKLKYQDGLQITAQVRSNPISDEELRDLLLKE